MIGRTESRHRLITRASFLTIMLRQKLCPCSFMDILFGGLAGDSEEPEVVGAGGQRVAALIGEVGVEEKPPDVLAAELPDAELHPGGLVLAHVVNGDGCSQESAESIVACHTVEDLAQVGAAST